MGLCFFNTVIQLQYLLFSFVLILLSSYTDISESSPYQYFVALLLFLAKEKSVHTPCSQKILGHHTDLE